MSTTYPHARLPSGRMPGIPAGRYARDRSADPSIKHLEVYPQIGNAIAEARIAARLTQAELAACVDLTRTSLVNIECGRQRLTIQMLYDLAEVLEVDPKSLLPEAR